MLESTVLQSAVFLTLLVIICRAVSNSRRLPLPPGPPGLPIIGNALQISQDQPWLTFAHWAEKYGEIMHLSVLGQSTIIVSSAEAVRELLVHRGTNYSGRPESYTFNHILGWDKAPVFCSDRAIHTEGRKAIIGALTAQKMPTIHSNQEAKCLKLLCRLMTSPNQFHSHIQWFMTSIVFELVLGHEIKDADDPLWVLARRCMDDSLGVVIPGSSLIDVLPILRHVPEWMLTKAYKTKLRMWRTNAAQARAAIWDLVKERQSAGIVPLCFLEDLMTDFTPERIDFYQQVAITFYTAGADTTISSIESFFLAMSLFPDVQKRAQAEIDTVLGQGTLPTFEDRQKLPYLDAVMKELHRWNPTVPLALPHALEQDDVYKGYRIPASSIVIPNSWAIMHDPAIYPEPFAFKPERYLTKKEVNSETNLDPRLFAFGYGRRICPGQTLAESSLFILMATVLAVFNVDKAVDDSGNSIEPTVHFSGIVSHPGPFECKITPRSEGAAQMVASVH